MASIHCPVKFSAAGVLEAAEHSPVLEMVSCKLSVSGVLEATDPPQGDRMSDTPETQHLQAEGPMAVTGVVQAWGLQDIGNLFVDKAGPMMNTAIDVCKTYTTTMVAASEARMGEKIKQIAHSEAQKAAQECDEERDRDMAKLRLEQEEREKRLRLEYEQREKKHEERDRELAEKIARLQRQVDAKAGGKRQKLQPRLIDGGSAAGPLCVPVGPNANEECKSVNLRSLPHHVTVKITNKTGKPSPALERQMKTDITVSQNSSNILTRQNIVRILEGEQYDCFKEIQTLNQQCEQTKYTKVDVLMAWVFPEVKRTSGLVLNHETNKTSDMYYYVKVKATNGFV